MTQSELFQTAVTKARAGERNEARQLLLQVVESNPQHELAWLWLSELIEGPEDKIIALENALTINPKRSQTQARLHQLRQRQSRHLNGQHNAAMSASEQQLANIRQQILRGNTATGRQELATFLHLHTNHEAAWWLMVQHADSQSNQLVALDHLLRLNNQHTEAIKILADIIPKKTDTLQMGRIYERLEQWETAVHYYKRALKSADKQKARARLRQAETQLRLENVKTTSPTTTVLRLAIGPSLLYALLVLIQSGLNPMRISPLLFLGNILLFVGLLLRGGLSYAPDHLWLNRLRETAVFHQDRALAALSRVSVSLSILFLLLRSFSRLVTFILDFITI